MANKEETFLLVSLEEDKAKKLAQVISNDTCRKILDELAKSKSTETELSRKLNIPMSTVHYNITHLVDNKLVEAEEFHYSEKGKEVLHYSLSNKYVIIAPKGVSEKFRDKLRSIIPAITIVGAVAIAIELVPRFFSLLSLGAAKSMAAGSLRAPAMEKVGEAAVASAPMLQQAADTSYASSASVPAAQASQSIGLWFALGAVLFMIIYLVFEYMRKRSKEKD